MLDAAHLGAGKFAVTQIRSRPLGVRDTCVRENESLVPRLAANVAILRKRWGRVHQAITETFLPEDVSASDQHGNATMARKRHPTNGTNVV